MRGGLWVLLLALSLPASAERLISLGGDVTEIIYALGAGDRLVGVDTTSYYPPAATRLPQVGYLRNLATEGVLSLKPDRIVYSAHAGPPAVLAQLRAAGVQLDAVSAEPSVQGLQQKIQSLGALLRCPERAAALSAQLDAQAARLQARRTEQHTRVLFLLSHAGPAMAAGRHTAADAVIALAGGENVAAAIEGYKTLNPEALASLAPQVIVITALGLQQLGGAEGLWALPGIALTPAGQHRRLIVMDALKLLSFGPRSLDAALELQSRLQAYST